MGSAKHASGDVIYDQESRDAYIKRRKHLEIDEKCQQTNFRSSFHGRLFKFLSEIASN